MHMYMFNRIDITLQKQFCFLFLFLNILLKVFPIPKKFSKHNFYMTSVALLYSYLFNQPSTIGHLNNFWVLAIISNITMPIFIKMAITAQFIIAKNLKCLTQWLTTEK